MSVAAASWKILGFQRPSGPRQELPQVLLPEPRDVPPHWGTGLGGRTCLTLRHTVMTLCRWSSDRTQPPGAGPECRPPGHLLSHFVKAESALLRGRGEGKEHVLHSSVQQALWGFCAFCLLDPPPTSEGCMLSSKGSSWHIRPRPCSWLEAGRMRTLLPKVTYSYDRPTRETRWLARPMAACAEPRALWDEAGASSGNHQTGPFSGAEAPRPRNPRTQQGLSPAL